MLRIWSEQWRAPEEWLGSLETLLQAEDVAVRRGGDFDSWDLEALGGIAGGVRLKMAIEEHGAGKQMLLFSLRTQVTDRAFAMFLSGCSRPWRCSARILWWPGAAVAAALLLVLLRVIAECSGAGVTVRRSLEGLSRKEAATEQSVSGVVYLGWS